MMNDDNSETIRMPLPKKRKKEMFGVVERVLGGSRMRVSCEDGKSRLARIPGSKKRSIKRIRSGDLVILKPWDIQDEKADILLRYRRNQAKILSRKNMIPSIIDVF
ncbi:MAG: translation initiation factor eIF-1A [Candidatus Thermoplasmatota archaeon]